MKKHILAYLLTIFSLGVFAQNWKPYKIDDSVQVSLPPDFKQIDTLGQTSITARTDFGYIQITKLRDSASRTPDIEKVKTLRKYYDNYVKQIQQSSQYGIVSNETDTTISNLRVKDFTMAVDSGSGKQVRNFRIIHTNNSTYTFQYLYKDISSEYAIPEGKEFFNSIKFLNSDSESQFTRPENTTGKKPAGASNRYKYIGAGLLLVAFIIFLIRRRRKIR